SPGAAGSLVGSEDCLYLNVYRPGGSRLGARLPGMVFIHGSSNLPESANLYDPSDLVAKNGIIVVTTEHRLNALGFLAAAAFDAESGDGSSGNCGLMDQQAALRWVHNNIRQFGGDPLNVTVAGESAGGIDICAHLVSPAAAGLFRKAILESSYCPTETHD